MVGALSGARGEGWHLSKIAFLCNGNVGTLICDTGASITAVSQSFVRRAKLPIRAVPEGAARNIQVADGKTVVPVGVVDLPLTVQLILTLEDGSLVHWDRRFTLNDVWVLPLGDASPRDLYVSWADFKYTTGSEDANSPLGSLAHLVMSGAVVLDTPRVPKPGSEVTRVVIERRAPVNTSPVFATLESEDTLREQILARIPEEARGSALAARLVDGLLARRKVFGPLVAADCTEVIDFELIGGEPETVSFRVPIARQARAEAATEGLTDWINRGFVERVDWSTPAYGFVIVVPKANGKFRVTINPGPVNKATKRIDPEGGYMPSSMINEAQKAGRLRHAATLDLAEAFVTMKLGPEAQRLSTFTSPIGKLQWKHGYFGWHSFPAAFQRIIMERVVLPTLDEHTEAVLLAWIDDLVVGAMDEEVFLASLLAVVDRILAFGGRLSLAKCNFLVSRFDWCGVEVDLPTSQWRVAAARVSSLTATPIPRDREALGHVLGIIRYYYWGVTDQLAQRARLAKLVELDVPGTRLEGKWTAVHTTAMRGALDAIVNGEWLLVYDPTQPVVCTVDASGNHGFAVVANQYDKRTGKMRPIAFFSRGWLSTQIHWTPQVKECYACRYAATKMMPTAFPWADIELLCDNKNLAGVADSEDKRVQRWQQEIRDAGCVRTRYWIPGDWNSISDYGSRTVVADPTAQLTLEERFEGHIYSILGGEEGRGTVRGPTHAAVVAGGAAAANATAETAMHQQVEPDRGTVVPGHLPMASMVAKIVAAQAAATDEEHESWSDSKFTKIELGGRQIVLFDKRLLIPRDAKEIKVVLMRMAHDDVAHYTGAGRTVENLVRQARVHWVGMHEDVATYISSCYRCEFVKTAHKPAARGTLNPTVAPHVHHTWYVDLKGPMPHGTGYLMVAIEAVTWFVKLRYLRVSTAKEVCEELEEAIHSFGTAPVVIRSDGGQPFDSEEYRAFCSEWGIQPVIGVAHHSQGQGLVETRFRGIASAIMASLGAKAPHTWAEGPFLGRLEGIINATGVASTGGSPSWALNGREPRTRLSAVVDWSSTAFGDELLGSSALSYHDLNEIIASHHASMNAVQGRVSIATSLAQALTKNVWDAARQPGDFTVDEWVLIHHTAPNRLLPYFTGPYRVVTVTEDKNFVKARHYLAAETKVEGPFHCSRLIRFNMSRATKADIALFQVGEGSGVVDGVVGHRRLQDGSHEFHVQWLGYPVTSWLPSRDVKLVTKVHEYCREHGLPLPGLEPKKAMAAEAAPPTRNAGGGRGGRRGGRGGRGGSR